MFRTAPPTKNGPTQMSTGPPPRKPAIYKDPYSPKPLSDTYLLGSYRVVSRTVPASWGSQFIRTMMTIRANVGETLTLSGSFHDLA